MKNTEDVIVAGAGPAGIAAALAAARKGADVLLVESYGFAGGMATQAVVPALSPYSDGDTVLVRGIALEIRNAMVELCPELEENLKNWQPVDPEIFKIVLDRKLKESGVRTLFHSHITGVEREGAEILNLRVSSRLGERKITARRYIDCTGDASLVAWSGGEFLLGDGENRVQALTLCFRLANVDLEAFRAYKEESGDGGNLLKAVERARGKGDFPFSESKVCAAIIQRDGTVGMNFGHSYNVNPLDPEQLTRAEMESRRQIYPLTEFMRRYVPGFSRAIVISSGPVIGIRETRRIVGESCITAEDYQNRAYPSDSIGISNYPLDVHSSNPAQREKQENAYQASRYGKGEFYGIPYRTLLPKGYDNLIVAGRSLSSDRLINGSCRLMNTCMAMGQAAGTAAVLSLKEDCAMRVLDRGLLVATLRVDGQYLP